MQDDGVEWNWIVFIDLPAGQATWHIHDDELPRFSHLPRSTGREWDGHTTAKKYDRVEESQKVADQQMGEYKKLVLRRLHPSPWLIHRPVVLRHRGPQ